ncbi:MAG: hypothetical protein K1W28_02940 [Lachnospiraceae bacterium]
MNYGKRNDEKDRCKEKFLKKKRFFRLCFCVFQEKGLFQKKGGEEEKKIYHLWSGDFPAFGYGCGFLCRQAA